MFWRTLTVALWCLFSSATPSGGNACRFGAGGAYRRCRPQTGWGRALSTHCCGPRPWRRPSTLRSVPVSVRAGSGLERSLRDFDRLARRPTLSTDRCARSTARWRRLRRAFDEEFERQSRQLPQDRSASAYARAAELDNARRRVDELSAPPPAFRRLLVVQPSSADTVTDLDRKIAILVFEQTRGDDALTAARNNLRAGCTHRHHATTTRRTHHQRAGRPQDLRLVQRQVDDVRARLRDIEAARDERFASRRPSNKTSRLPCSSRSRSAASIAANWCPHDGIPMRLRLALTIALCCSASLAQAQTSASDPAAASQTRPDTRDPVWTWHPSVSLLGSLGEEPRRVDRHRPGAIRGGGTRWQYRACPGGRRRCQRCGSTTTSSGWHVARCRVPCVRCMSGTSQLVVAVRTRLAPERQ